MIAFYYLAKKITEINFKFRHLHESTPLNSKRSETHQEEIYFLFLHLKSDLPKFKMQQLAHNLVNITSSRLSLNTNEIRGLKKILHKTTPVFF